MLKDMKRIKIMTYFLSFIVAMLDSICNPHLYEDFYKYLEYETYENWCWDGKSINKAQGLIRSLSYIGPRYWLFSIVSWFRTN